MYGDNFRQGAGVPVYSGPAEPELGLFEYFVRCFTTKYASFYGRARRKEYWGFTLFTSLFWMIMAILIAVAIASSQSQSAYQQGPSGLVIVLAIVLIVGVLATILPGIAVTVRRFHDIGQSGWIVLIFYVAAAIPYVNFITSIIWLVMLCLNSQPHENKYGPPPKNVAV